MMSTRKGKKKATKNVFTWDLPNGPVVKNPPSNVGEMSWIPSQRTRIPHATRQLSLSAYASQ